MKTLMPSMLLACLSFVFPALAEVDSSCAFNLDDNLTLTTQLQRALPNGKWVSDMQNGQETVLQFHTSGTADWFTFNENGLSGYKNFTWTVTPLGDDQAQLVLAARDYSQRLVFEVKPACQSLKLTEVHNGFALTLEHESAESKARRTQKESILAASWENTTYPFDLKSMDGAYLKYCFHSNGRFERMLGDSRQNIKSNGEWWLDKDGQHLVMRFESGETTVAEIKYLELDEMVLQHVLNCENRDFATGNKDFFFNRQ